MAPCIGQAVGISRSGSRWMVSHWSGKEKTSERSGRIYRWTVRKTERWFRRPSQNRSRGKRM